MRLSTYNYQAGVKFLFAYLYSFVRILYFPFTKAAILEERFLTVLTCFFQIKPPHFYFKSKKTLSKIATTFSFKAELLKSLSVRVNSILEFAKEKEFVSRTFSLNAFLKRLSVHINSKLQFITIPMPELVCRQAWLVEGGEGKPHKKHTYKQTLANYTAAVYKHNHILLNQRIVRN